MIFGQVALLALLGSASAMTYYCRNADLTLGNGKGTITITEAQVHAALEAAGPGQPGARSQYPHAFVNAAIPGGVAPIKWQNPRCNVGNMGVKAEDHHVWEYPILLNQVNHKPAVWQREVEKDKQPQAPNGPGPARVIFIDVPAHGHIKPGKEICGVIAHTHGSKEGLRLCDSAMA